MRSTQATSRPACLLLTAALALTGCGRNRAEAPIGDRNREGQGIAASRHTWRDAEPGSGPDASLATIPAGRYWPLYRDPAAPEGAPVASFLLETTPVTNARYLAFVTACPSWRRSAVAGLFADERYLAHWHADLAPPAEAMNQPVTNVSWFAARAYARWVDCRLPTTAEWEVAARADEHSSDARSDPAFLRRILDWYGRPARGALPTVGQRAADHHGVHDLHGVIWEWTEDFNTSLVTGESRGDAGLDRNLFCGAGAANAIDPSDYAAFMRYALRSGLAGRSTSRQLGFRCARSLDEAPR